MKSARCSGKLLVGSAGAGIAAQRNFPIMVRLVPGIQETVLVLFVFAPLPHPNINAAKTEQSIRMYRKDDKIKWSWLRLITNAVPNFTKDEKGDELTPTELDNLFNWQVLQDKPKQLNNMSYFMGGITTRKRYSERTHKSLIKVGILHADNPTINTNNITSKFVHQQAHLSLHMQRKLVNLLFAWEEELMRWRLLEEEEAEIKTVMEEERSIGRLVGQYEGRLKELEGLMKLKPSLRSHEARKAEVLPEYADLQGGRV